MDNISLTNFRCFRQTGTIPVKPLTVLVGENSTGKSSFLAALRLAWDFAYGLKPINFNEEPFLLGAFDQISHFRGGRGGRADKLSFAFESRARRGLRGRRSSRLDRSLPVYQEAEFSRHGSHPVISKQILRYADTQLTLILQDPAGPSKLEILSGDRKITRTLGGEDSNFRMAPEAPIDWRYVLFFLERLSGKPNAKDSPEALLGKEALEQLEEIAALSRFGNMQRPVALAPVRSRPQRTYNPISDTPLPEGEHVPMVLAKMYFADKDGWQKLKSAIDSFGAESGLFSSLEVKGLGRHESDPFQIRVRIEGPPSNLVDVGYGVSQVLPILVDALQSKRGTMFLLQQPEVHLHPKAQAALGSFLLRLSQEQSAKFVIETHSDFLLDRLRMQIRDSEDLDPEDVSILFFERDGVAVNIHPISIDSNGDLQNAPSTYRKFFLEEERRFLGL